MVGKTNLTFISKGEDSDVQLIQKSYVTDATGEIYKIEIIKNRIFAFVYEGGKSANVLMGMEISNLVFAKRNGEYLKATHIIYAYEKYYLIEAGNESNCAIYATIDFQEYEQINLTGANDITKWGGLFLDSHGRIVFMAHMKSTAKLFICESLKDLTGMEIVSIENDLSSASGDRCSFFADNKIYVSEYQINLLGSVNTLNYEWRQYNYVWGYFLYISDKSNGEATLFRSRDGKNMTRYEQTVSMQSKTGRIVPVSGKLGILYKTNAVNFTGRYRINIADDILSFGHSENINIPINDDIDIKSVMECDEKTYLGTANGLIYEYQLNFDGIIQRPDVAVIKTLAAREALAKSLQYTDECIKELKNYFEQKVQEELQIAEDNSIDVELGKNGD